MGLKPKCVFLLKLPEEECIKRLGDRRVDPKTGEKYNTQLLKLSDRQLCDALKQAMHDADQDKIQELGLGKVAKNTLNVLSLDINEAKSVDLDILSRLTSQQEDNMAIVKRKVDAFNQVADSIDDVYSQNGIELKIVDVKF